MWKESPAVEPPKIGTPQIAKSNAVTEDELRTIVERLEATRDIFRENRELRNVLSRREAESKELRARNSELEEIMRKVAPMLLSVAATMGLAPNKE